MIKFYGFNKFRHFHVIFALSEVSKNIRYIHYKYLFTRVTFGEFALLVVGIKTSLSTWE